MSRTATWAKRIIIAGISAFAIMSMAMLTWTFWWPDRDPADLQKVDAIVCLGAGMDIFDRLGVGTKGRVARCVKLYEAGLAPVVIFTGGLVREDGPSAARQMGIYAQTLGLPRSAVVEEGVAQSTLQNAVFTLELPIKLDSLILVTEAFHLPRSWASFRWAAWELGVPQPAITMVMSEQVRHDARQGGIQWRILRRETQAIWFNLVRALAYSAAPNPSIDWLR